MRLAQEYASSIWLPLASSGILTSKGHSSSIVDVVVVRFYEQQCQLSSGCILPACPKNIIIIMYVLAVQPRAGYLCHVFLS